MKSKGFTNYYEIYVISYSKCNNLPSCIPNYYEKYKNLFKKYLGKNIIPEKSSCFKNTITYLLSYLLCKTKYYIHFDVMVAIKLINNTKYNDNFITNSINLLESEKHISFISLAYKNQIKSTMINEMVNKYPNAFIFYSNLISDGIKWENGNNEYNLKGILDKTRRQPQMSCQAFICDVERVIANIFPTISINVEKKLYRKHIEAMHECCATTSFFPIFVNLELYQMAMIIFKYSLQHLSLDKK